MLKNVCERAKCGFLHICMRKREVTVQVIEVFAFVLKYMYWRSWPRDI